MINLDKLVLSSISCVPILAGVYLGGLLRKKLSEILFKKLFNYMLGLMGLILISKIIF